MTSAWIVPVAVCIGTGSGVIWLEIVWPRIVWSSVFRWLDFNTTLAGFSLCGLSGSVVLEDCVWLHAVEDEVETVVLFPGLVCLLELVCGLSGSLVSGTFVGADVSIEFDVSELVKAPGTGVSTPRWVTISAVSLEPRESAWRDFWEGRSLSS